MSQKKLMHGDNPRYCPVWLHSVLAFCDFCDLCLKLYKNESVFYPKSLWHHPKPHHLFGYQCKINDIPESGIREYWNTFQFWNKTNLRLEKTSRATSPDLYSNHSSKGKGDSGFINSFVPLRFLEKVHYLDSRVFSTAQQD